MKQRLFSKIRPDLRQNKYNVNEYERQLIVENLYIHEIGNNLVIPLVFTHIMRTEIG